MAKVCEHMLVIYDADGERHYALYPFDTGTIRPFAKWISTIMTKPQFKLVGIDKVEIIYPDEHCDHLRMGYSNSSGNTVIHRCPDCGYAVFGDDE